MAAAYAASIVGNHPFVDGNKRFGMEAALLFLILNGVAIPDEGTLKEAIMELAQGRLDVRQFARRIRPAKDGRR